MTGYWPWFLLAWLLVSVPVALLAGRFFAAQDRCYPPASPASRGTDPPPSRAVLDAADRGDITTVYRHVYAAEIRAAQLRRDTEIARLNHLWKTSP